MLLPVLDEFDAIARTRGGRGGSGDQGDAGVARDSVVNQLLVCINYVLSTWSTFVLSLNLVVCLFVAIG